MLPASLPTVCFPRLSFFLSCPEPAAEFVFEETYQTCVVKGARKILPRAQKTPSKKLKPALTSKRHVCCFSGWCLFKICNFSQKTLPKSLHLTLWDFAGCTFKTQYGQKDMERHLKTHTGTCGCLALDGIPHVQTSGTDAGLFLLVVVVIQVKSRLSASCATSASVGGTSSTCTAAPTRARSRTSASTAPTQPQTAAAWRSTCASTTTSGRSSARSVPTPAATPASSRCTSARTQVGGVVSVSYGSSRGGSLWRSAVHPPVISMSWQTGGRFCWYTEESGSFNDTQSIRKPIRRGFIQQMLLFLGFISFFSIVNLL